MGFQRMLGCRVLANLGRGFNACEELTNTTCLELVNNGSNRRSRA